MPKKIIERLLTLDFPTRSQIQGIFDPVIQEVIKLVQSQARKIKVAGHTIRAILLVGGFGGSKYLFRLLCKAKPENHRYAAS